MNFRTVLQVLILCIPLQLVGAEKWTRHTALDKGDRYHLYWNPPEDKGVVNGEILFKVEVRAKGYVGFGLSPNGGMAGSDIVTGWVMDGQTYFQDRHGVGNTLPRLDQKQNWILMAAQENETHTTLQFRRKLNTCDEEDMVIEDSAMRVIYAFSDQDPMGDNPFYHHSNRGAKSVHLLDAPPKDHTVEDPSLLYWDLIVPKIDISSNETLLWCTLFKTPSVSKKHSIVKIEPLIQEGNEEFVHHMVLYECVGGEPGEYEKYVNTKGYECNDRNKPAVLRNCRGTVFGWVIGGEGTVFPEHVGLPLVSDTYYSFEIHYNNPQRTRVIDESGLRIYYTPNIRKYDAGFMMIGAIKSPEMFIPPGQETYVVTGHSNTECLRLEIPAGGIKIIATLLHAHMTGRRIIARHFRGNKELPPIAEENNYNFYYQEFRYHKEEINILPGDLITIECTYDSSGRTTVTFGGDNATDEMCIMGIKYYPRIDCTYSLSAPTISTINSLFKTNFTDSWDVYSLSEYNWTNVDMHEVQNVLRYSGQSSECVARNGQRTRMENTVFYPRNFEPFIPADAKCDEDLPESFTTSSKALSSSKALRVDGYCSLFAMALAASFIRHQRLLWM